MPRKAPLTPIDNAPTLAQIKQTRKRLDDWIVTTPVWQPRSERLQNLIGKQTQAFFKLELLQAGGSFKARGALTTLLSLEKSVLQRGVVAASAGNHAIGVSYAAKMLGVSAKVIMPKTASPIRMQRCKEYGAEIILVETLAEALEKMQQIAAAEHRYPIHPFEGPLIALGAGTIGLELAQQIKNLDAVIVPIGGGGLCAGIANAIKQLLPKCQVFGVEPEGADTMYRSFAAGQPVGIEKLNTIADCLAAPAAMPYSFALCRDYVDDVVRVSDAALVNAMELLFYEMKLAVEPAAAATTAALCGPLKDRLQGKRVAIIVSGTNLDLARYCELLKKPHQT